MKQIYSTNPKVVKVNFNISGNYSENNKFNFDKYNFDNYDNENNSYIYSDNSPSASGEISNKRISSKDIETYDEKDNETEAKNFMHNLQLNPEDVVKGIIYSEILGKPKALSPFIRRKIR